MEALKMEGKRVSPKTARSRREVKNQLRTIKIKREIRKKSKKKTMEMGPGMRRSPAKRRKRGRKTQMHLRSL
jgi:hypothetical protein